MLPLLTAVGPMLNMITGKTRKEALSGALGKIAANKESGAAPDLSPEELSTVATRSQKDSWKDEFVTIITLAPIGLLIVGAVVQWWTGDRTLYDSASGVFTVLRGADIDLYHVIIVTVVAAFWQKLGKR